jgi:aryl-alcohol dehydrogenase-like predicted oxidoreductase
VKLAVGTVQFGLPYGVANQHGQVTVEEGREILQLAKSRGIDTLDTAVAYGDSEQRLGEIGVHSWNVVSKLPALPLECEDVESWTLSTVLGSLRRLRIDQLQGVLLHNASDLVGTHGDELQRALQRAKSEGLVRQTGVSIYAPADLQPIFGKVELDLVQCPFNVLDTRLVDSGWLDRLSAGGVEVHVRSIYLQGLLLMARDARPDKFSRWSAAWNTWTDYLERTGQTALQACVRFAAQETRISRVVVGIESAQQLQECLAAAAGARPVGAQDIAALQRQVDETLIDPRQWNRL